MILEELAALILQARPIAVRFQPAQLYRLNKSELTILCELANKKTRFIERNSNYHTSDFNVHKDNERLLQTILESKQ